MEEIKRKRGRPRKYAPGENRPKKKKEDLVKIDVPLGRRPNKERPVIPENEEILSREDFCERYSISLPALYKKIREGEIICVDDSAHGDVDVSKNIEFLDKLLSEREVKNSERIRETREKIEKYKPPRKGDRYLSPSAFCRVAGLDRTDFRRKVALGQIVCDEEERGKVDTQDPTNISFVEKMKKKAIRKERNKEENIPDRILRADLLKKESDARWKAIKAKKEMNDLLDKGLVKNVFDNIGRNIRELFFPIGARLASNVAALCGCTDSSIVLEVQRAIDIDISKAIEDVIIATSVDLENDDTVQTYDSDFDDLDE